MTQTSAPARPAQKPTRGGPAAKPLAVNPEAKIAHGWLHTARFLTTAPDLQFLPAIAVPEIAFVGRSNAGKSTCINSLTQQKQLAPLSLKLQRNEHGHPDYQATRIQ